MKLNIAFPATGLQKIFEIEDEKKLRIFYEKRMAQEVDASPLGDEWAGYVLRISGGNDKQGFPMKQGVLTNGRVRLLLSKGHSCYRPRRTGERKRKSVRGCIVDANLSVLSLVVVKKGAGEIPGLTDSTVPRRLGPKRASKIKKLFNLSKEDDVRRFVIRRKVAGKEGKKEKLKAPKIQRLITPLRLQRKRHQAMLKRKRAVKRREEAASYHKLVAQRLKEKQAEKIARRRSSASRSQSHGGHSVSSDTAAPVGKAPAAKAVVTKPVAAKPAAAKPSATAPPPAKKPTPAAAKPAAPKPTTEAAKPKPAAAPAGAKEPAAKKGKK